jgi:hypothetical protein
VQARTPGRDSASELTDERDRGGERISACADASGVRKVSRTATFRINVARGSLPVARSAETVERDQEETGGRADIGPRPAAGSSGTVRRWRHAVSVIPGSRTSPPVLTLPPGTARAIDGTPNGPAAHWEENRAAVRLALPASRRETAHCRVATDTSAASRPGRTQCRRAAQRLTIPATVVRAAVPGIPGEASSADRPMSSGECRSAERSSGMTDRPPEARRRRPSDRLPA